MACAASKSRLARLPAAAVAEYSQPAPADQRRDRAWHRTGQPRMGQMPARTGRHPGPAAHRPPARRGPRPRCRPAAPGRGLRHRRLHRHALRGIRAAAPDPASRERALALAVSAPTCTRRQRESRRRSGSNALQRRAPRGLPGPCEDPWRAKAAASRRSGSGARLDGPKGFCRAGWPTAGQAVSPPQPTVRDEVSLTRGGRPSGSAQRRPRGSHHDRHIQ